MISLRNSLGGGSTELGQIVSLSANYPPLAEIGSRVYLRGGYSVDKSNVDPSIVDLLNEEAFIHKATPTTGETIMDISTSGSTWIIVISTGRILRSSDSGVTWATVFTDTSGRVLRSIYKHNGVWVCAGGDDQDGVFLRRSLDDGLTWQNVTYTWSGAFLVSVYAFNNVWICCGRSTNTVLRSTDNGATWSTITVPSSTSYGSVYSATGVWYLGGVGSIARSVDEGLTWSVVTVTAASVVTDIYKGASGTLLVVTDQQFGGTGSILRSTDNGLTWTEMVIPVDIYQTASPQYTSIIEKGGVWYAGSTSTISSTDDGLTWKYNVSGLAGASRFSIAGDFVVAASGNIISTLDSTSQTFSVPRFTEDYNYMRIK